MGGGGAFAVGQWLVDEVYYKTTIAVNYLKEDEAAKHC